MRLNNKVAIVTGGGSGIGRCIALTFANEGAQVVICGRREEPLKEVVKKIEENGGEAMYYVVDVISNKQIQEMVEETILKWGHIDILVNNAGIYKSSDIESVSTEDWDSVMDVDVKGVFQMSKAIIPHMLKLKKAKIINIASIAGLFGFEMSASYCAAKGAVINLTRAMALDYAGRGICVNAIAPGIIESDMTKPMLSDENAKKMFLKNIPVDRIGTAEDIAYTALFLASNESNYIIGQTLIVDGGWTIR